MKMEVKQLILEEITIECYSAETDDYKCEFCDQICHSEDSMMNHILVEHPEML